MFYNDVTLKSLDLSNFITKNVTNMESMFGKTTGLTDLNIANFDTDDVTSIVNMFTSMGNDFDRVPLFYPNSILIRMLRLVVVFNLLLPFQLGMVEWLHSLKGNS
ncbi:BspA family leucine-rich repeat surface protein [Fructobacillus americanaquae]|uniref:BspA family leucine-rich repeat surface protein n=2 Tax=Fructobacillus americanaquae TaxID=2940302 RepID=A0ABY5BZE0_9LACO|nr:BspA family leucine-rich repeat surface protein [Fructobacillus americanaquae]USS91881.1 BspA family leucine-rich repeat surface protein [Fructobacillus americanaquae]